MTTGCAPATTGTTSTTARKVLACANDEPLVDSVIAVALLVWWPGGQGRLSSVKSGWLDSFHDNKHQPAINTNCKCTWLSSLCSVRSVWDPYAEFKGLSQRVAGEANESEGESETLRGFQPSTVALHICEIAELTETFRDLQLLAARFNVQRVRSEWAWEDTYGEHITESVLWERAPSCPTLNYSIKKCVKKAITLPWG